MAFLDLWDTAFNPMNTIVTGDFHQSDCEDSPATSQELPLVAASTPTPLQVSPTPVVWTLFVTLPCDFGRGKKSVHMLVEPSTTVLEVRDRVLDVLGVWGRGHLFWLTYEGHVLAENVQLQSYGVGDASTFALRTRLRGGELKPIVFDLNDYLIDPETIMTETTDEEADLSDADTLPYPPGARENSPTESISMSPHTSDSESDEPPATRPRLNPLQLQLLVRTVGGRTLVLISLQLDTCEFVKLQIQVATNFPTSLMVLQWRGAVLEDRRTLESYGITDGDLLVCTSRLLGGSSQGIRVITLNPSIGE